MTEDMRENELRYYREGQANLLLMHDKDKHNIAFNLLKTRFGGLADGLILVGATRSEHIVTPSVTARGLLNICVVAAAGAQHDLREV
jgi:malate dehydrogenase (oxaloacetate-decarboxylating)(NADP+)